MARLAPLALVLSSAAADLTVTTEGGVLRGVARDGVNKFLGVPFAAPPTGELRWAPPQPAGKWSGVRDASRYQQRCVQDDGSGSEDCLYLNVFQPLTTANSSRLPVLLWVHGGGYEGGSAKSFDASRLVSHLASDAGPGAAIAVTVSYRLNIFGFLGGEVLRARDAARGSTGNAGLQDQRAAMAWVQRNIASFGGDPSRVAIFGESAGAGSMSCHLAMPASRGLFSAVIIESGSFAAWVAEPLDQSEAVLSQVLNATGCPRSGGAALACLTKLPAAALTRAVNTIPTGKCCAHTAGQAWIPWSPTVDGVELPRHPWHVAKTSPEAIAPVPVLHGTNTDEGTMFEPAPMTLDAPTLRSLFAQWYGSVLGAGAADRFMALYYTNRTYPSAVATRAWWAAMRSLTDQNFACSAAQASSFLARRDAATAPVFQYEFAHPHGMEAASHCAELPYVFYRTDVAKGYTDEEAALADTITAAWYNMAAHGNPSGPSGERQPGRQRPGAGGGPAAAVAWPRFTNDGAEAGAFLRLDVASKGGCTVGTRFHAEACAVMGPWIEREIEAKMAANIFI